MILGVIYFDERDVKNITAEQLFVVVSLDCVSNIIQDIIYVQPFIYIGWKAVKSFGNLNYEHL